MAGQADIAALLEALDGAVLQTLQARRQLRFPRFERADAQRRADARRRRAVRRGSRRAARATGGHDGARRAGAACRPSALAVLTPFCAAGEHQGAAYAQPDVSGRQHEVCWRRERPPQARLRCGSQR